LRPRSSTIRSQPVGVEKRKLTILHRYFAASSGASSGSRSSLNKVFDKYREDAANSPDSIGIDGTMKYLSNIDVDIEGLESLAALELVQAPAMGEISREGFVNGWSAQRYVQMPLIAPISVTNTDDSCDTLDKQKAYMSNLKQTLPTSIPAYTKVYNYTFQLAKSSTGKGIPLDTALVYWELLFTSPLSAVKWHTESSPWFSWWSEFLTTKYKRSINKDIWSQTLKFAQLTLQDEAMGFWNEEAAWPSVIDDFVMWVKNEKREGDNAETMEV
jgi:hypothetical protein